MRVRTKRAPWILQIWLNQGELEALSEGEILETVSQDGTEVLIRPGGAETTRLARTGPERAEFYVPSDAVEEMVEAKTRSLKAVNGALPLSVTLSVEWGIGVPAWLIEADLHW